MPSERQQLISFKTKLLKFGRPANLTAMSDSAARFTRLLYALREISNSSSSVSSTTDPRQVGLFPINFIPSSVPVQPSRYCIAIPRTCVGDDFDRNCTNVSRTSLLNSGSSLAIL